MKILFVAPLNSIHSQRWIQYFSDKKTNEVFVLNFEEKAIDIKNANVFTLKTPKNFFLKCLFFLPIIYRARRFIRKVNPDFIHIHWISFVHYFLFYNIAVPLIATPWGSDVLINTKNPLIAWFIRRFLPRCACCICDAQHLKEKLVDLGADREKVRLIYFGTDVFKFNPGRKNASIRKTLGFEECASVVLSLRSLKPIYDVRTFVLAVPEVLCECDHARFVIVGRGEEKPGLIQLAKDLGVSERVRFLEGLSDEEMQVLVASVDIYVSTSLSDGGLAASTAEAMASEVPVVITDFGENSQWVENSISGFLFPLRGDRELAEKLVYLIKNPSRAKDIAKAGRKVIEERNNYYKEMEKTEAIYQELVQSLG